MSQENSLLNREPQNTTEIPNISRDSRSTRYSSPAYKSSQVYAKI